MEFLQDISLMEWIGYLASLIIAISMAFSSILKFRVTNLVGAAIFSVYGFIIGALPVGIMNGFIVLVDLYYLIQFYWKKDRYELLEIKADNPYVKRFVDFHKKDITHFFPKFDFNLRQDGFHFLVLRNVEIAGIFSGIIQDNHFDIVFDYVTPQYRDFKNGKFVIKALYGFFKANNINALRTETKSRNHAAYLRKIGFVEIKPNLYEKQLEIK